MAPPLKALTEIGSVCQHDNGWRVWVKLGRNVVVTGPTHRGHAARREAKGDLAEARQASTREEMQRLLQDKLTKRTRRKIKEVIGKKETTAVDVKQEGENEKAPVLDTVSAVAPAVAWSNNGACVATW